MDTTSRSLAPGPVVEDDRALHARLVARDPLAPADLALAHLERLSRWLSTTFPWAEPHLLETAAIDLILDLAERPERYHPGRSSLASYLRMAARRDVFNALRSERRRAKRQTLLGDVELAQQVGNSVVDGPPDPADVVASTETVDPETLAHLRSNFDDMEWEFLQLMLERERRTAVYARVLRLADQPEIEQAREVKRVKDRVWKRLQRLAPKVCRDV